MTSPGSGLFIVQTALFKRKPKAWRQTYMNTQEIFKRLMIGLSLVAGYFAGKLAASFSPAHYSALFSAGFLAGAIGTQGAFHLFALWRRKRQDP